MKNVLLIAGLLIGSVASASDGTNTAFESSKDVKLEKCSTRRSDCKHRNSLAKLEAFKESSIVTHAIETTENGYKVKCATGEVHPGVADGVLSNRSVFLTECEGERKVSLKVIAQEKTKTTGDDTVVSFKMKSVTVK